jgi:uncharacterized protein
VNATDVIVRTVLEHYPTAQAIYLFGSYGTADEWPDSDVDVAVLLPPEEARRWPQMMPTTCQYALEEALGRSVDLLSARQVSTVFQKQILKSGRSLHCADDDAVAELEMLTLSYYQALNEERRAILDAFHETGKAYAV